ncbi:MAG: asparagine synthase-related protein, partial [Candidatus Thorarchaeota archaeon]
MCGILAIRGISYEEQKNFIETLLSKRGPDGLTYYFSSHLDSAPVIMIASRLALVGTDEFPLKAETGELLIANGEIYNYKELYHSHLNKNPLPSTNDLTFIVDYYSEEKNKKKNPNNIFQDILHLIKADYALLIYDPTNDDLFIARDTFGIRPLWYYWDSSLKFGFASEKKLLESLGINDNSIVQVPPNSWTKISLKKSIHLSQISWHSIYPSLHQLIPPHRQSKSDLGNLESCIKATLFNLIESIKTTLGNIPGSNAKVGVFFSGGLDSSVLLLLASQLYNKIIPITVGTENSSDYQFVNDYLAIYQNFNPISVLITEELVRTTLPTILSRLSSPTPLDVSIALPIYLLSRQASAAGIKVCLTGQGADELFAGYHRYIELKRKDASPNSLSLILWDDLRNVAKRNIE